MLVKHFYLQCRCVNRAVQNQSIKCEMNFLIAALQGHENPYKIRGEGTLYVYKPLAFHLKCSSFFLLALKAAPVSLPCLSGMRLE